MNTQVRKEVKMDNSKTKKLINDENKESLFMPETFKEHLQALIHENETSIPHSEILNELLDQIERIDFENLAFPNIETIRKSFNELQQKLYTVEQEEREEIRQKIKILIKDLSLCKLNNKHYIVLSIENVLSVAMKNKWNLCKNMDYVYLYNGTYWSSIEKEAVQRFLGEASQKQGVEKISSKFYQFKEKLFSQFICEAYLPHPKPNKNLVLINLLNGTFEINGKETKLRPFSSKDFLTYQLPFNYDPIAKAPIFQKYLDTVIPEIEKQKVLAEYLGSIFIKHGSKLLKEEKALILYGTGANGKSVFFEIVNALLGSQNISYHSLQDLTNENGYHRAMIGNKLLNYASEINGKLEASIFKQMVSGEPISARLPYGQPMELHQYAKLIFNCNELPKDVEQTNAFFRRFLILTFEITIAEHEQDKQLHTKIIDNELAGVFNWVLEGLNRLINQGRFTTCESSVKAVEVYKTQSDSVKLFIQDNNYTKSTTCSILLKELYKNYRDFCLEDGFKPVNKQNFNKRIQSEGVIIERSNRGYEVYLVQDNIKF